MEEVRQSESTPQTSGPRQTSLLEAVLMESMRTHCGQATAVHRTAVQPFTFSDGYTVPAGQSVQFYQGGVHYDEKRYDRPETFDPTRFQGGLRSATDISMEWPFWGVGKNSWYVFMNLQDFVYMAANNISSPGRFFFTYAARLLASCLLTEFDCELKGPVTPNFQFGESSVPSGKVMLLIKRKGSH